MKKVISLALAVIMIFAFAACSTEKNQPEAPKEKVNVNAYVLSGPTGIGAVNMMKAAENGEGLENYKFNVVAAPDEIVSKISNGEADIAAVATNLAAKLYKVTNGGIKIIAVNTLGVLNVLNFKGEDITSLKDLKGRTIYTTGQGANPEYIIDYLLTENGINPEKDVKIEFKADGTDLVPVWATDPEAVIIAPQPVATSIKLKYEGSKIAIDLTDEWNKVNPESELMMGCVIVRNEFLNSNPEAVEAFLTDYEASIKAVSADIETTATLCEEYGIVAKAPIAKAAIPNCNICFIKGNEMKEKLTGYLQVLYNADPTSIGGAMPDDNFWYAK
ncbi:MAG: ABC transporter substrate-binding protein [Eubacterium sp.]|nr:ABC transporter substrate-binding protein [Eubacterium sp.]